MGWQVTYADALEAEKQGRTTLAADLYTRAQDQRVHELEESLDMLVWVAELLQKFSDSKFGSWVIDEAKQVLVKVEDEVKEDA